MRRDRTYYVCLFRRAADWVPPQKGTFSSSWQVQAYKYVPFGRVDEVMPYLIRRAQENSAVLGGVASEKRLISLELRRRLFSRA